MRHLFLLVFFLWAALLALLYCAQEPSDAHYEAAFIE